MIANTLSMESVLLLALTLIPIGVLVIAIACLICHNCINNRNVDDTYLNVPPWNQPRRQIFRSQTSWKQDPISETRRSTVRFMDTTDSEHFRVYMLNGQRQAEIIV